MNVIRCFMVWSNPMQTKQCDPRSEADSAWGQSHYAGTQRHLHCPGKMSSVCNGIESGTGTITV